MPITTGSTASIADYHRAPRSLPSRRGVRLGQLVEVRQRPTALTERVIVSDDFAAREHPGRSRNPVIKVRDLAWLQFEKPDLNRAEAFAQAFGFTTVLRTADELHLRGTDAGSPCVTIRRASRSRFVGPAFAAQDMADVERLAEATGAKTSRLPEAIGGVAVELTDPAVFRSA